MIDGLAFEEPKTKRAVEILDALSVEGRILLVLAQPTDTGAVEKSFRNLVHVRVPTRAASGPTTSCSPIASCDHRRARCTRGRAGPCGARPDEGR